MFDFLRRLFGCKEMRCCCPPSGPLGCCVYADLPATGSITDGTNTYTITKGTTGGGDTTYAILSPSPATLCGFESTGIAVTCTDGEWIFDGAEMPCVGTMETAGDCSAFVLTFDCFGCTITASI